MGTGQILVASVAAGEAPEVEARLEEAAFAAAVLERVLAERQPIAEPRCPEGECRPAGKDQRQSAPQSDASRDDAVSGGEKRGGRMGGMGMHQGGGMSSMGGMHEAKSPTTARGDSARPLTP